MFDWFLPIGDAIAVTPPGEAVAEVDAIDLLKNDHDSVKELFALFKQAADRRVKTKIAKQALMELKIHAVLEEEIFYPAVRRHVGKDVMNEADEEHHVAKVLIAELEEMDARSDHYDAKFSVLAESVRHHIREEESEMLPRAQDLNIDFVHLGRQMLRRREELLVEGFPPVGEEIRVRASHGAGDSPAKAARKKPARASRRSRV
jgi:hemerythrin-like domain-containing protein